MATLAPHFAPPPGERFAPRHRLDPIMIRSLVAMIWIGILAGFVPDIVGHIRSYGFVYPPIVHLHALAFVGWLLLLTLQVTLVGTGRVALHRRLGVIGMALAPAMVVLGLSVGVIVDRAAFGTKLWNPAFLSIQVGDMLAFAGVVGAAFALRRDAAAHKRLILLSTIYLTDAGFGRFFVIFLPGLGGPGWWGFYLGGSIEPDLLIVALGVYDVATRGRLHPVYLPAVLWLGTMQACSIAAYFTPAWRSVASRLLGL